MTPLILISISRLGGGTHRIQMSRIQYYTMIAAIIGVVLTCVVSVAVNVVWVSDIRDYHNHRDQQHAQRELIDTLKDDVQSLRTMMQRFIEKEAEIREDLGRPKRRSLSQLRRIQNKRRQFDRGYPTVGVDTDGGHELSAQISYMNTHILRLEKAMRRHSKVHSVYVSWFQETPSIWPVLGYVRSGFGWRVHPIHQQRQFHKGIDIPAWTGAPVQATGDGYVEFSGWANGYGWMVVVTHPFGFKTFYAHLSELDVHKGTRVKKGQVIGKIGSSGLSTGPHIHYEIRHSRKALDPVAFLNMDLFTAISTLW